MARENVLFPAAGPEDGEAFAFESAGEETEAAGRCDRWRCRGSARRGAW
jgi:hypothetical protein